MYKRILTAALVFGMVATAPPAAHAQLACGDRDAMVEQLSRTYGEVRKGAGLAGQAALFEVWASDSTGTWTILKTSPNGTSCLIAAGEFWRDEPPVFTPAGLGDRPM
ncbi:MAG: hypothetical protein ACE5EU_01520 [Paracoccaceae bacterium]